MSKMSGKKTVNVLQKRWFKPRGVTGQFIMQSISETAPRIFPKLGMKLGDNMGNNIA